MLKVYEQRKLNIVYYIKEKLLYLHDSLYFLREKYIVEWTYIEKQKL